MASENKKTKLLVSTWTTFARWIVLIMVVLNKDYLLINPFKPSSVPFNKLIITIAFWVLAVFSVYTEIRRTREWIKNKHK